MLTCDYKGNTTPEYKQFMLHRKALSEKVPIVSPVFSPIGTSDKELRASISTIGTFSDSGLHDKVWRDTSYQNATYDKIDKKKARRSTRQAMFDSTIANGIVSRFVDSIVDRGLYFNSSPDFDLLGLNSSIGQETANTINKRFHLWASSKYASLNRTQTFYQQTRMACLFQQRDNEYYIRFHYDNKNPINPLSISFVDPDCIYGSTDTKGKIPKDRSIVDGIQYDKNGREVAYYFYVTEDSKRKRIRVPAYSNSGLPLMAHGFTPEFADQKKGMPLLYNCLQEFEFFKTFELAQINSAIKQASIALLTESSESDATNPFQDLSAMRAGVRDYVENNDLSDQYEDSVSYTAMSEVNLSPGDVGVFNLRKGEKLKGLDQTSPTEQFSAFSKAFISHLAICRSMPYEVLLMQFNQNYSASRAALILFYRIACVWKAELVSDFVDIVKEAWAYGEVAANRLQLPGFTDPSLRQAWLVGEWIGPPMPDIDPLHSVQAQMLEAKIGSTTLDRISRERNGSSFNGNVSQLEQEYQSLPSVPWEETRISSKVPDRSEDA